MEDGFDRWLKGRTTETEVDDGRLLPGTVVGAYRVEAFLGRGGFAEVYRARSENGKDVAIKLLHLLDEKSRRRFERESQILAQVHHRNLPLFLGFGTCGERPYIVTELLHPCELPERDRAVERFVRSIMSAVEELHRSGYVHRDIKPANILCRADGEPVLIDFGLSTQISSFAREKSEFSVEGENKVAVGTLGYSAPEQFAGLVSGPASDVHALGALIGACFGEKMPRAWKRIYLTATNSNPDVRYQTVAALRRAVSLRYLRKWLWAAFGVIVLASLAYLTYEKVCEYRVEHREPIRFRE